jgi:hypothetical protein
MDRMTALIGLTQIISAGWWITFSEIGLLLVWYNVHPFFSRWLTTQPQWIKKMFIIIFGQWLLITNVFVWLNLLQRTLFVGKDDFLMWFMAICGIGVPFFLWFGFVSAITKQK